MMMLSNHFSLAEATASQTAARSGIDNSVSPTLMPVMTNTAEGMERIRTVSGGLVIHIDSWYRCLTLNRALGSADTSQHLRGEAVDFIIPTFGSPLDVCKFIVANRELIGFDQLILEHTWVHISFCGNPAVVPRGNVLSLLATGKYATGLTDKEGHPL